MSAEKIQIIIDSIAPSKLNSTGNMYLNILQNEFITFNGNITIPRISVNELDYMTAVPIVEALADYVPEFLQGHRFMENRMPATDQHSLHFSRRLRGRVLDFVHILRINFLFGGDSSAVVEKGDTDYYPAYITNRIYYKSRLVPAAGAPAVSAKTGGFVPVRLVDSQQVETDSYFHTFAMFEELNEKGLSQELCRKLGEDMFPISLDLYQFISYDYFTACMNVLYPTAAELSSALELFELVFIFLHAMFRDLGVLLPPGEVKEKFLTELGIVDNRIIFEQESIDRLKAYFGRFSLYRDDDLMLKGWRRFDMKAWSR
jgi:hypothetical protein